MIAQKQFCLVSYDPIQALLDSTDDAVLTLIAGVDGPSYRPLGAMMAVFSKVERVGSLSSGCIEADISLHAMQALRANKPYMVRYGRGSPYIDIRLPCGGGLDILLLPRPNRRALNEVVQKRNARKSCTMKIDIETGHISVHELGETRRTGSTLCVKFNPEIRFLVFGAGPEASTFSALVKTTGYPSLLLSPDPDTLDAGRQLGCETRHLANETFPEDVHVDDYTAVVLFFHDHDWEPIILAGVLKMCPFYIGAQGSLRARDTRNSSLRIMGVSEEAISQVHGPVGLIPSARDPGTLAVSVLAEVLAKAMVIMT